MKTHPRNLSLEFFQGALSRLRQARALIAPSRPGAERAQLDTAKWTLELLKRLEWRRFEELAAAYFELLGFTARSARAREGGGSDIALYAASSEGVAIVVHCRAWNAHRVGIKSVQALRAAMAASGAREGALVTPGRFTGETEAAAPKERIQLIDGADLLGKLAALPPEQGRALLKRATQGDFLTPTCPCCAVKMTARQSISGGRRYWGCPNYPKCKEIVFGPAPG